MYRYGFCVVDSYKGSGSLLIKTTKEIKSGIFRLYGQEKNSQTHALCRMNMFLHEINDSIIEWGDTLRNPLHLENGALKTFDIVIANPPFSLDKWGEEEAKNDIFDRFKFGIPPKSKGDYAFVLHMISSLNQNGTMGVILPHGVLFRGSKEGKIRQKLIEKNLLDAVIGLPANLFFGTSIPACIMIFKKNRSNNDIFFIDASKDYEKDKNQNTITKSHIEKIVNAYKSRQNIDKFAYKASLDEIKENDFNLNIPRYVDTYEEEEPIDIKATKDEISRLENELKLSQNKIDEYLRELGL